MGLAINQFRGNGIRLTTVGGDTIRADYIGTNAAGTAAMANGGAGILITDGSNGDTIGGLAAGSGDVISGNTGGGININASSAATPASGTIIEGNLIGTDVTGLKALGNGGPGINVNNGPNTQVGGTAAGARNIISGNAGNGVQLGAGNGTVIEGNYIGTDKTGAKALANSGAGVFFNGGSNDTVGGTAAGAGNVISGNGGSGIGSTRGRIERRDHPGQLHRHRRRPGRWLSPTAATASRSGGRPTS